MGAWYTTRETVMRVLDIKVSAYRSDDVDRAIESGSRAVESLTHRIFYPLTASKSWPYPNDQSESWTLWLDGNELSSLTTFTSGGDTVASSDYYLEPQQYGPPYDRIEINRGTSSALSSGTLTPQRSLVLTGVFTGCPVEETSAGALSGAIASTSSTSVTLTRPSEVGRILRVDSERMIVTEKSYTTSGQTVQTPLTAAMNNVTVAVTDGTAFQTRETLLIDSEYMLITAIAGNNLTVRRAVEGSVLAAHAGSTIYSARTYTVERGALGTTAATHSDAASVLRYKVPGLIDQLSTAYSLIQLIGEPTGYARKSNQNTDSPVPSPGELAALEKRAIAAHGRQARFRSV